MKTNKYLEIERKNHINLFPIEPKPRKRAKKKVSPRVDFKNQPRRCEMWGCDEWATKVIGNVTEQHFYCDKDWRRIIEKNQEGDLAETSPVVHTGSDIEGAEI